MDEKCSKKSAKTSQSWNPDLWWWVDVDAPPNGIGPICKFCHNLIDFRDDHDWNCPVIGALDFGKEAMAKVETIEVPIRLKVDGGELASTSLGFEDPTLAGPPQLELDEDVDDFRVVTESLVVTKDVAGVVLRVFHNGETWCVEGSSKRDPSDKPDYSTAYLMAMSRALESVQRQFARQADGRIRNNEWIRKERKKAAKKAQRAEKTASKKVAKK